MQDVPPGLSVGMPRLYARGLLRGAKRGKGIIMTVAQLALFLVILGMWNLTDGWFSISMYLGTDQTWKKDHYIRVIRILFGLVSLGLGADLLWHI